LYLNYHVVRAKATKILLAVWYFVRAPGSSDFGQAAGIGGFEKRIAGGASGRGGEAAGRGAACEGSWQPGSRDRWVHGNLCLEVAWCRACAQARVRRSG